jgi:hypothetical protein
MYLIRAEASARTNNVNAAMNDLNKLLESRYIYGQFVPLTASSGAEALSMVLLERKKSLIRRGLRWTDIRRLNNESPNSIHAQRNVDNQTYPLPQKPYLLLLPKIVIQMSGVQQN